MTDSQFLIPNTVPIVNLDCKSAFANLTEKEKKYAHYLSRASWNGGLICLLQCSPESPVIFVLLQKLFRAQPVKEFEEAALKSEVSLDDWQSFLTYAAAFYGNLGNYKSFGDTKFLPNLPKETFKKIVWTSAAYAKDATGVEKLWNVCGDAMYSLENKEKQFGLGDKGITTYFSRNCTMEDAELAQKFMGEKNISPYNTRLFKTIGDDKKASYEVRLASAEVASEGNPFGNFEFNGVNFAVTQGDYAPLMAKVADSLSKAKEYAANEHQVKMLEGYVNSFTTGSIDAHKDASRNWIKDKGPIVENYIGFIESYRDPYGVRGEWEGLVSMVNKEMSAKFSNLVDRSETLLPLLPWTKDYEKNQFLKPDFTSLEVLSFASSGIPAGINIPNYDDIRQNDGFKNVSLGNVLSAHSKGDKITFLNESDKKLFAKLKSPAFEVQVGLHELLGHGSGKLFIKNKDGSFNYDPEVKNLITGEKIATWYQEGETWDSKFSTMASTYEECRAECVGLYLCLNRDILKIFGHEGEGADDILYINWLNMVRAGLLGLEFYTPETDSWRQAHMQARYVILRVLLEAGQGLVTVTWTTGDDGQPDAIITLDRSKIETVGKEAIGTFLRNLQVYKSTADLAGAKAFYGRYSAVNDDTAEKFYSLRTVVLSRKQPRRMFVQVNTKLSEGDSVELCVYEASAEGLINSFIQRFTADYEDTVYELWQKDKPFF
ncbi:dipeptidyl peptidase 3-like [Anneissia japonica]|uniref:dipeptidyl peptidase 3-like n=1 Tax=Anneissia japonica TaxID=1529436 RepID=UPI00142564D6|nr:dipeptidyl peptidase 3-like [Anneissia japonica]